MSNLSFEWKLNYSWCWWASGSWSVLGRWWFNEWQPCHGHMLIWSLNIQSHRGQIWKTRYHLSTTCWLHEPFIFVFFYSPLGSLWWVTLDPSMYSLKVRTRSKVSGVTGKISFANKNVNFIPIAFKLNTSLHIKNIFRNPKNCVPALRSLRLPWQRNFPHYK